MTTNNNNQDPNSVGFGASHEAHSTAFADVRSPPLIFPDGNTMTWIEVYTWNARLGGDPGLQAFLWPSLNKRNKRQDSFERKKVHPDRSKRAFIDQHRLVYPNKILFTVNDEGNDLLSDSKLRDLKQLWHEARD